jgi:2-(1,2-epoxy-1,2-dihydrophenyl)acetyl-CoA isomerase
MGYATILEEKSEGYVTLTLNRPDRLNAFNEDMHRELAAALAAIAQGGEARALLLTGAGRGFCAGQDLSDRRAVGDGAQHDLGATLDRYYNPLIRMLRGLPLPVIAAVNGVAAGAGANVALACDIVLAARSASFIQAFTRIGLVPDSGGTYFLPRLVGRARATALMLTGEALPAERAAEFGLIWKAIDDATLMEEAHALARHLAAQPTKALALTKQALEESWKNDLSHQLDLERDLQRVAGRSGDYIEGVAAFLQKRKPDFKGR